MLLFFTVPTQSTAEQWTWMMNRLTNQQIRALYHEAYRILQNREDAEDVLQETLIIGATKCMQLKDESKLFSWLFSILRHEALAYHKHFRLRDIGTKAKLAFFTPIASKSAEQELITDHEMKLLNNAISNLKSPAKEIIVLHLHHNMSLLDIAKHLGMNYSTVRSRYKRTLAELKRAMEVSFHE